MKGYYEPSSKSVKLKNCRIHTCDHPMYNRCTVYLEGDVGLAVIQMRFSSKSKVWWWGPVDPWLAEDIFKTDGFAEYFNKHAGFCEDGLYPTVEVRKLMYAIGMKPMKKAYWEKRIDS